MISMIHSCRLRLLARSAEKQGSQLTQYAVRCPNDVLRLIPYSTLDSLTYRLYNVIISYTGFLNSYADFALFFLAQDDDPITFGMLASSGC